LNRSVSAAKAPPIAAAVIETETQKYFCFANCESLNTVMGEVFC
jgi:hypothetical protein